MDILDFLDKILPESESTDFECPQCKNTEIVLILKCSCKETIRFCFGCVMLPENYDRLRQELDAHSRKCIDAGRCMAVSSFVAERRMG